ncbi:MAG: hypothetical protein ACREF7_01040, partial [Candidatus Saccharimonadales bacterium]
MGSIIKITGGIIAGIAALVFTVLTLGGSQIALASTTEAASPPPASYCTSPSSSGCTTGNPTSWSDADASSHLYESYSPQSNDDYNPEDYTVGGGGGSCDSYFYFWVEGDFLWNSGEGQDGEWVYIEAASPSQGDTHWSLSTYGTIEGHVTIWVAFHNTNVLWDSSLTGQPCNSGPYWADQNPGLLNNTSGVQGAAIMDIYTDSTSPPSVSSVSADLAGSGTNLNSSNPTLQWDFNGVTDVGNATGNVDNYISGTQYYSYSTWIDGNNVLETSPPNGVSSDTGKIGAGASGYATTCDDGANCTFSSTEVALGSTSHFCITDIYDWLGNNQSSAQCGYEYISAGIVTLTPPSQTVPDTATGTLDVSSSSAAPSDNLILEDTTTGPQSVVITNASSWCGAISLTSSLSTSSPITTLSVTAINMDVEDGDSILLTSGTYTQSFIVSGPANAFLESGATSIPVDAQTPNYAYPVGTAVTDSTPHLPLLSGEELVLQNAGDLACSIAVNPVADGTYEFEAALADSNLDPYSDSTPATASVTWIPWQVTLSSNNQTKVVSLGSGTAAQLVANTAPNLQLQTAPGQELEIFSATYSDGIYTPTGTDLLAAACTSGTACPNSGYLSETQPSSNAADCITETYLNSCFIAEVLDTSTGAILASSGIEVEWQGSNVPPAPSI